MNTVVKVAFVVLALPFLALAVAGVEAVMIASTFQGDNRPAPDR
jgi:hypothetical protein